MDNICKALLDFAATAQDCGYDIIEVLYAAGNQPSFTLATRAGLVRVSPAPKATPSAAWLESYNSALRGGMHYGEAEQAANRVHGNWR